MCEENELPEDEDDGPPKTVPHDHKEEPMLFVEERLLQNKVLKLMIEKIKDPGSPLSSQGENGGVADNVNS